MQARKDVERSVFEDIALVFADNCKVLTSWKQPCRISFCLSFLISELPFRISTSYIANPNSLGSYTSSTCMNNNLQ